MQLCMLLAFSVGIKLKLDYPKLERYCTEEIEPKVYVANPGEGANRINEFTPFFVPDRNPDPE